MKKCELCKGLARTYCESDQASLCWTCDVKVHGANFLVARHSRSVLCHACQAPTPWKASGSELGVTVSVCESCVVGVRNRYGDEESLGGNDDVFDTEDDGRDEEEDDYDDDDGEDEDEDEDEEDAENQVVPWSSTSTATPPPPATSSSSSEECVSGYDNGGGGEVSETASVFSLKRMRDTDLPSQGDLGRPSLRRRYWSELTADGSKAAAVDDVRPLKDRRIGTDWPVQAQTSLRAASSVAESPKRFRRQDIGKLSEESGAIDLNSPEPPSRPI